MTQPRGLTGKRIDHFRSMGKTFIHSRAKTCTVTKWCLAKPLQRNRAIRNRALYITITI